MRGIRRRWMALITAAIAAGFLLPLGSAVSAQASTTCTSPAICFWQGGNFNGTKVGANTSQYRNVWISLTANGLSLPWGSVWNNSGSCTEISDHLGNMTPILPHVKLDEDHISLTIRGRRW